MIFFCSGDRNNLIFCEKSVSGRFSDKEHPGTFFTHIDHLRGVQNFFYDSRSSWRQRRSNWKICSKMTCRMTYKYSNIRYKISHFEALFKRVFWYQVECWTSISLEVTWGRMRLYVPVWTVLQSVYFKRFFNVSLNIWTIILKNNDRV